ncbi:MAG: type II toxin-antitoxin system HicA family toxin [Bryobacteraceae bacterium]
MLCPNPHEPAFSCSPANTGSKSSPESRFLYHHTKGSHQFLKHLDKPELPVTIPLHNTDLKQKTLASIIKQAGYTPEDFLKFYRS